MRNQRQKHIDLHRAALAFWNTMSLCSLEPWLQVLPFATYFLPFFLFFFYIWSGWKGHRSTFAYLKDRCRKRQRPDWCDVDSRSVRQPSLCRASLGNWPSAGGNNDQLVVQLVLKAFLKSRHFPQRAIVRVA